MKRSQLIQIAIIAVALVCAYKAIESLTGTLITILYEFSNSNALGNSIIIQYLFFTAIYFAAFFLSIKYNRQIAAYIDKGQINAGADSETIPVVVEEKSLLFIVITGVCLATLLTEIPVVILAIYNYFKKEAGGIRPGSAMDIDFKNSAIKFVFTLIILFYARWISVWFSRQITPGKPVIETINES
jgi:hypothetical protein